MGLFGRRKTTIGLDIGSGLIKVAVIDHGKGEPELTKVAIAPLLADAIVEGEIMDPGIVADAIRAALSEAGIKGKNIVTAVGGRDVIIKKIQIDRMKETQAREVIRWEAEQHVPFDMESVSIDFEVLDPEGDGLQMDVLLVAAKMVVGELLAGYQVDLPPDRLEASIDMVVRLVLSHVMQPSADPATTADDIAWVAERVLG